MSEMNLPNEELDIITLTDEDGTEEQFVLLDLVCYEGDTYAVLLPMDDPEAGEVVILQVEDGGEEGDDYITVEDEIVLDAVYDLFREAHKGELNFEE